MVGYEALPLMWARISVNRGRVRGESSGEDNDRLLAPNGEIAPRPTIDWFCLDSVLSSCPESRRSDQRHASLTRWLRVVRWSQSLREDTWKESTVAIPGPIVHPPSPQIQSHLSSIKPAFHSPPCRSHRVLSPVQITDLPLPEPCPRPIPVAPLHMPFSLGQVGAAACNIQTTPYVDSIRQKSGPGKLDRLPFGRTPYDMAD